MVTMADQSPVYTCTLPVRHKLYCLPEEPQPLSIYIENTRWLLLNQSHSMENVPQQLQLLFVISRRWNVKLLQSEVLYCWRRTPLIIYQAHCHVTPGALSSQWILILNWVHGLSCKATTRKNVRNLPGKCVEIHRGKWPAVSSGVSCSLSLQSQEEEQSFGCSSHQRLW